MATVLVLEPVLVLPVLEPVLVQPTAMVVEAVLVQPTATVMELEWLAGRCDRR